MTRCRREVSPSWSLISNLCSIIVSPLGLISATPPIPVSGLLQSERVQRETSVIESGKMKPLLPSLWEIESCSCPFSIVIFSSTSKRLTRFVCVSCKIFLHGTDQMCSAIGFPCRGPFHFRVSAANDRCRLLMLQLAPPI